jgi:hypothetical protein
MLTSIFYASLAIRGQLENDSGKVSSRARRCRTELTRLFRDAPGRVMQDPSSAIQKADFGRVVRQFSIRDLNGYTLSFLAAG